jgi:hypothetical protein
MKKGDYALQAGSKPFEFGGLFVRLFRCLDAIVGGNEAAASACSQTRTSPSAPRPPKNPLLARPHECHRLPGRTQGYHLSFDRMHGAPGASSRPSPSSQP